MCQRFTPFTVPEAQMTLEQLLGKGSAHIPEEQLESDAFPGSSAPLFVPDGKGILQVQVAHWGFQIDDARKLYFNTRLDTALKQLETGKGLWARAIKQGRCLVPARAFYERHSTDIIFSDKTGKPIHRPYRITMEGYSAFLIAGIFSEGRFSLITTEPNSFMAPIHNRMPLVLGAGESSLWLKGDFEPLAKRDHIELLAKPIN